MQPSYSEVKDNLHPIVKGALYAVFTNKAGMLVVSYFLKNGGELAIFDAGFADESLNLEALAREGIGPDSVSSTKILVTHGHGDHTAGTSFLRDKYRANVCKLGIGLDENGIFPSKSHEKELVYAGIDLPYEIEPFRVDEVLKDGSIIPIGDLAVTAYHGPGHSRDSSFFTFSMNGGLYLVVGDTVGGRQGELGNLDLAGSNALDMAATIRRMIEVGKENGGIFGIFGGHSLMYGEKDNTLGMVSSLEKNLQILYAIIDQSMIKSRAYERGPIVPPNEHESLIVRTTRNCEWNRCTFCGAYGGEKFNIRPLEEVLGDINSLAIAYRRMGRTAKSVFLQDANGIAMKHDDLVYVLTAIKSAFPEAERITSYSRSKFLLARNISELRKLREAGLTRLHVGLETGSNTLLDIVQKGVTAQEHIEAGKKVKDAGIELILALGGKNLSDEHIKETADSLNSINPDFIRLRTYFDPREELAMASNLAAFLLSMTEERLPFDGYQKMTDPEKVEELRKLIAMLDVTSTVTSDHNSNVLLEVEGKLPEERESMLAVIDGYLSAPMRDQIFFRFGRELGIFWKFSDIKRDADLYGRLQRTYEMAYARGEPMTFSNVKKIASSIRQRK